MTRLADRLRQTRGPGPALMTHVVLGYPSLEESIAIVRTMADAGASSVELQIPFSDPLADGPTIQFANEASLALGTTPKDCMKAMEVLASSLSIPLLFMGYFNTLFRYGGQSRNGSGLSDFFRDAKQAGATGLIVPDIPPEEAEENYWNGSQEHGLAPIPIVTPVTSDERLKMLTGLIDDGFIYCVSITGTTGARDALPAELESYIKRVRTHTSLPLGVGFGISQPAQVKAVGAFADIAIVGSATIALVRDNQPGERLKKLSDFVAGLVNCETAA